MDSLQGHAERNGVSLNVPDVNDVTPIFQITRHRDAFVPAAEGFDKTVHGPCGASEGKSRDLADFAIVVPVKNIDGEGGRQAEEAVGVVKKEALIKK